MCSRIGLSEALADQGFGFYFVEMDGGQMLGRFLLVGALGVAAFPVSAQSFLEKLNSGLKSANAALSGNSRPADPSPSFFMPSPTEAQLQKLAGLLVSPAVSVDAKPLWDSARERLAEVLIVEACYPTSGAHDRLKRYLDPGTRTPEFAFSAPMSRLNYHPKDQCLSVDRIDNINVRAKNAFSFRTIFVSDASGETEIVEHRVIRQTDGEWLFSGH